MELQIGNLPRTYMEVKVEHRARRRPDYYFFRGVDAQRSNNDPSDKQREKPRDTGRADYWAVQHIT